MFRAIRRYTAFGLGLAVGALALASVPGSPALAADIPKTIAWSAYNVGSTGYIQSAAIGDAVAKATGVTLRVVPAGNDIARLAPLRQGRIQFSATGSGSYLAQEGVLDFADPSWGPQPLRLLLMSWADTNTGNACTAKDAGIRTMADLKGKRVAWVHGAPALNNNMTAFMAFGGVTWDDVKKVEFPGFKESIQGLVDGVADAAIASTDSGLVYALESSPRGIYWPETPKADKAGWERLHKVAPYFAPHLAIAGAGLSREHPQHGASYGYPILVTYPVVDDDLVYWMTKQVIDLYDQYKGAHPGAIGWALDRQVFDWAIPYDAAAVRYFKERGVWNDEFQRHNDQLLKRQDVLHRAWVETLKLKSGGEDFRAFWMKRRAAALRAAGFEPIWEE
ncbi:MAG TPA: TAXI family TRAP transporter solute-binding subunit [bacterium]|nr:TAXI family TRAP transporter solute-binding subunit [bacterium]